MENTKITPAPGQDFSRKMVVVLNKDAEPWRALNGLGHSSAYLGNKMSIPFDTGGDFVSSDGALYPKNSQFPLIVLQASNKEMRKLLNQVRATQMLFHAFVWGMPESNDDEEVQALIGSLTDEEVEIYTIGIFGLKAEVDSLTSQFRLWRSS